MTQRLSPALGQTWSHTVPPGMVLVASPGKPVRLPAREYLAVGPCWLVLHSDPMPGVLLGLALPQDHPQGTLCPP